MSRALCCDNCGTVLPINAKGENDAGEDAAWLVLKTTTQESFDLCTRSCMHEFIDRPEFVEAIEAWQETIAEIAGVIRDRRGQGDDE